MSPSVALAAPVVDFRRAPGEIYAVVTREELRAVLIDDLVAGRAAWISMEGLALANRRGQTRALKQLARFKTGLAGLNGAPHTGVLDWSTAAGAGGDVLAIFPIVAALVGSNGAALSCCEPRDAELARAITRGRVTKLADARWVGDNHRDVPRLGHVRLQRLTRDKRQPRRSLPAFSRPGRFQLLGPVQVLNPSTRDRAGDDARLAFNAIGDETFARTGSEDVATILTSITREIVSNALTRTSAQRVSLAYGIHEGGAPRIEVAVADDGLGIAAEIRRKMGIGVLDKVPERHFVGALLRGVHQVVDGYGRGFVRALSDLITLTGGRVRIRTGSVLADVGLSGVQLDVLGAASIGIGTAIQIAVPLPEWKA